MSKWFSVRSKAAAAVLILVTGLGACERRQAAEEESNSSGGAIVSPEMRVDAVPQEEPAVARQQWRAVNDAARNATGNLRVSIEGARGGPVVFAFANGITVRAQPIGVIPSAQRSGVGGQSFAAVMGGDPRVDAHLYRVLDENVANTASQGGLCGGERVRHLAVSEFVDSGSRWVFKVAAFKGENQPGSAGEDPQFCAAYTFAAQN